MIAWLSKLLSGFQGRLIRAVVAKVLADGIAVWQHDPRWAWLLPVFLAASKALRDKYPGKFEWVPV